jgi:hypothetical protein
MTRHIVRNYSHRHVLPKDSITRSLSRFTLLYWTLLAKHADRIRTDAPRRTYVCLCIAFFDNMSCHPVLKRELVAAGAVDQLFPEPQRLL